ncbi:Uncharacterised protein [Legionella israelensis]|uniref:Uncharacterized protein n=1 Tax=Legionella israelensis TaxID=454 RepID=A0A0W0VS59_9GAMM|nr:hypothetical protein Lisr_1459 [Legionella israelensis]SCY58420.1 hypothetical protein SAMN02746069_02948 [Legionella israelensis DSM 19235]STX60466.1 Uncharacterised protein [Legionella israelensis]
MRLPWVSLNILGEWQKSILVRKSHLRKSLQKITLLFCTAYKNGQEIRIMLVLIFSGYLKVAKF